MKNLPDFEEAVLRPVRFNILNKAFDMTPDGRVVTGGIQKYVTGKFSETALERIFGQGAAEKLMKLDLAAQHLASKNFSERIIPKLVESGMVGSAVLGAATGEASGIGSKAIKALSLMAVWNNGLARMMNNPRAMNRMLDGLSFGPTDGRFSQAAYNVLAVGISEMEKMRKGDVKRWHAFTGEGVMQREKERAAVQQREQVFEAGKSALDVMGSVGVGP